jgi:tetratricopeptide (TPR) repeat protein
MCKRFLPACALGILFLATISAPAQDIDSNPSVENRNPATVADQILDPAERRDFLVLFQPAAPAEMLKRAKTFLSDYPQSAFLFQAYDIAARSSFDSQDYKNGLDYANKSLKLLPENPLLLTAAADVEAREQQNDAAVSHARDAIEYLDRFARPGSVAADQWPQLQRKAKASAYFAMGRAFLAQALQDSAGSSRVLFLQQSEAAMEKAEGLSSDDAEIRYLLGLIRLTSGKLLPAAGDFSAVYKGNSDFAPKALAQLQTIHKLLHQNSTTSFEAFLEQVGDQHITIQQLSPLQTTSPVRSVSAYAGSDSCRGCHSEIYSAWSHSGMSKMLRPYQAQNVIGDFQTNNEFYAGDEFDYRNGKLEILRSKNRSIFARMVVRSHRHFFDIRQSDGQWHSYPVDYTIGSKFQQAYATKLPNGEIHVFPVQYNSIYKQWVNFWQVIDSPGSERSNLRSWEKLNSSTSYQAICAVCHTSQLRNIKAGGFEAQNLEFQEPGINCESCHGPSAQHIAEVTQSEFYLSKHPLDPPVNFHKVGTRDFVEICSQCHMQSALRISGRHGELNYSPSGEFFMRNQGIPFGEFSRKGFYKDGRFRQTTFIVEALERSQCFKKGQASCGNCHDPHGHGSSGDDSRSNPTSLKFPGQPDRACIDCHQPFLDASRLAAHTHHRPDSEGSRCVSCHMPRIMDALLFRARTHQIDDIPDADMTLRFGQEESPNACLLCHAEKNPQWAKQELLSWMPAAPKR